MVVDERKLRILKIIIDDFINTAQPVGSRTIAKKYPIGISSATIRNEMADLEELGYLMQPHTSAGRIPSDQGYRLYVDSLMGPKGLEAEKRDLVKRLLVNRVIEVEDIAIEATRLLHSLTGHTAIITMPQFKKSTLTNMRLVKINDSKALLIMVADSGVVKTLQINLSGATQEILDVISNYLVNKLYGTAIEDIQMRTLTQLKMELPQFGSLIDYLIPIMKSVLSENNAVDVFVEGTNSILNSPEFADLNVAKRVLEIAGDKQQLFNLLKTPNSSNGLCVKIGSEIGVEGLDECAIISAGYCFNGSNHGSIGVLGPKRLEYSTVISAVDYVRETLTEIFSGINL